MPGFQVKFEDYSIGGEVFHIRSLLDRQQYFDPDGAAERAGVSPASWPLFGMIWPSGQMLAAVMSSYEIHGKHILEVGCGIALASIVLQRRGADITTSDYHPMVPAFLAANTHLNSLADIETIGGDWANSEADAEPELFDLIIGSDLLYERDHFEMLSAYIHHHARADAEVVIVDPGRGHVGKFNKRMAVLGYGCIDERVAMQLADESDYRGRMLTYRQNLLC